jgi:RNA polymerase sigma-70 factor (family 1)
MRTLQSLTDLELIALLQAGDIAAFTEIHERYYGVLYIHAYKRLPDREEVKDILQELFSHVWNNKESLKGTNNLPAYLYASVRNRILNIFRHKKIRSDYVESFQSFLDQNNAPIADEILQEKELVALIEREIASLPPQMRLIFDLSRNAHLSHKEIAEKLNISPLTVKKQVNNSLKILRTKLGMHFLILFF